jgi:tetratricopeptide (TPR) repeat protein
MPPSFLAHLGRAILEPVGPSPLGPGFDRNLWVTSTGPRPDNPQVAALVDLAHAETRAGRFAAAAAVSRIARALAPDEPAPQLILPIVGPWLRGRGDAPAGQEANFHRARGDAYRILGDAEAAASEYRAALTYDPDLVQAYIGLSELRLPGEPYVAWLDRLHQLLQPRVYLEIGVEKGRTLGLARPPTRAVGVDPQPDISVRFRTETHVYAETSDAFFVRSDLHSILGGPVDFAFIDGMHVFQQALRDFINIEALCHRGAVIALHDTYPLDEITQRPERHCRFYSGDVWKTVACLRELRPDLQIQTIATPWTGLTIITGLDPQSRVLSEGYDAAVARVADYRYEAMEGELPQIVGLTPNDWDAFASGFARRAELRAPAAQAPAGA